MSNHLDKAKAAYRVIAMSSSEPDYRAMFSGMCLHSALWYHYYRVIGEHLDAYYETGLSSAEVDSHMLEWRREWFKKSPHLD